MHSNGDTRVFRRNNLDVLNGLDHFALESPDNMKKHLTKSTGWWVVLACLFTANAMIASPFTNVPGSPLLFAGGLSFPQAVQISPNTIRIPFTWVGRLPAVTARIDTTEGIFFFDTGAERLLLNERYFTGDTRLAGYSQYGVTGGSHSVFAKEVDTLKWENLYLPNVTAHVLDLSHIESKRNVRVVGIIGYEVFKEYEVLLDYPLRQIVLSKLDARGQRLDQKAFPDALFDSLDFVLAKHGIVVQASVEGKTLNFNLDTGAEINLLDRNVNKKVLKQFKVIKRVNLNGAGQQTVEVLAGTLTGVQCGKQRNAPMNTLLTSTDQLKAIFGMKIDGVLGFEFLRPRRTIINYKLQKLYFLKLIIP